MAKAAGLLGRKWVLDSTPVYDAVATMDTVTLIRSAIRGLLRVADTDLEQRLRSRLRRDDDYANCGKPVCDYDDPMARHALVDALAGDAMALLTALEGDKHDAGIAQAAQLLATVVGQDLDGDDEDGVLRIARAGGQGPGDFHCRPGCPPRAQDLSHGFDGYKGHIGIDPDSEIITATTVTAGNAGGDNPDRLAARPPSPPCAASAPL